MMSRGFLYALGTGARKSLVLLWTAVLLCSLLLQYVVVAAPPPALAIDLDGLFELDGNVEGQATPGDDWNTLYNGGGSQFGKLFVTDPINGGTGEKIFTGGDTKDIADIPSWLWTGTVQPQDKNDIEDAYAAAYRDSASGHLVVYFGLDRYAANGEAQAGFWFLQDDDFAVTGSGSTGGFSGEHVVGDVLVQIDFENGGTDPVLRVYEWQAGGLALLDSGGSCATLSDDLCAIAATASTDSAWPFQDKFAGAGDIPTGGMVEGGIDLTELGLDDGCFASFLAETRSSHTPTSTLSDFALGAFALCAKPQIVTHVRQGDTNVSIINKGESVTDVATLTGDNGTVTGSVEFFTCFDADAAPDCSTGGTSRGSKTLVNGSATSNAFTPASVGHYCFRVEYTPAAGSKYLADSHTNKTTECVQVIPAEIDLTKTADASAVPAGDSIGFVVTILSKGPGSAFGVKVTDTVPANAGLNWSIDAANTTGTWSLAGGVLSFGGTDGVTMAQGASFHVHITSPTTPATCGTVDNTGNATTTNDGTDQASASVEVRCPDVRVIKDPNNGSINAGETATFTIKVENIGIGTAKNVTLADNLPGTAAVHWTEAEDDCSIAGADGSQVLSCTVGNLAPGAFKTYTVSANLAGSTFCGPLNNSATATAGNERASDLENNTDTGSIGVLCASIDIEKVADAGSVSAGDPIGFTITVTSNGPGDAKGVQVTDTLPTDAGTSWTIDGGTAAGQCGIAAGVLTCNLGTLASGQVRTVHISSPTTKDTVPDSPVSNTAKVTTTNDGSDEDTDLVIVLAASIDIEKVADAGSVSAGDKIGFTITVTSTGPGTAKGVQVTDALPTDAGTSWSIDGGADAAQCGIAAGVLSCTFGDMAKDAVKVVHISSPTTRDTVPDSPVSNTAHVSTTNDGSDSDTDLVIVLGASIDIEKVADAPSVSAGDKIGFTITVTSNGPAVAKGVQVTDTLPTDAGTSWSIDGGTAAASCGIAAGVLTCNLGDLASGQVRTVHISSPTTKSTVPDSPVSNTAVVTTTNDGSDNDTDQVVVLAPDVRVDKNASNSPISAGQKAEYTIEVKNIGQGIARNVTLEDTLPPGIEWVDDSDACTIEGGVLECAFGDLDPNESVLVTVSGETDVEDCGPLPNTAEGFADNEPGNLLVNNKDSASIQVDCPAVAITKTPLDPEVDTTDQIGFDVVVTNTGDGTAFNVVVNDTLPTDAGLAWSIDAANSDAGWTIEAGVLKFGPANLAKDASVKVRIVSPTTLGTCPDVHNVAFLTYQGGEGSDDGDVIVNCPNVSITKEAVDAEVNATDPIAFDIVLSNSGAGAAFSVTVNDPLPTDAGLAWSIDAANSDAGWTIDGGALKYGPATLAAGASVKVRIVSGTTAASCGDVDNTAFATWAGGTPQASDSIVVECPDVVLDKTADNSPILAGQIASFTISVWNEGAGTAYDVEIKDTLPAGVDWQTVNLACSIDEGVLTCKVGDLDPEDQAFTVTVFGGTDEADCEGLENQATASATNEPEDLLENNTDGDDIDVQCASIELVKTAGNAADGTILTIPVPGNVIFTYVVTNTGTADLTDIALVDDNATPANTADDITVICPSTTLEAGDSMTCTATLPVAGKGITRTNIATVTATPDLDSEGEVSATDDAVVKVPAPVVTPRPTPRITPPPTSTLDEGAQGSAGSGLLLVLLGIAGLMLVLGYLMPAPARARNRRRNRKG